MKLKHRVAGIMGALALAAAGCALANDKPAELNIGISTYLSGPPSVFGIPAKEAADILVEDINAKGGIAGVPIKVTYIDEGAGGERLLSDYRRLVDGGTKIMFSAISS